MQKKPRKHLFGKFFRRLSLFLINFATAKYEHVNLIIDIGNTLAKLVAFDGDTPVEEIKTSNETLERLPEFSGKYESESSYHGQ